MMQHCFICWLKINIFLKKSTSQKPHCSSDVFKFGPAHERKKCIFKNLKVIKAQILISISQCSSVDVTSRNSSNVCADLFRISNL